MDFGDYAQVNELPSVMTYDHEYRSKQSTKKRKWGEDDIHLSNFYLVRQRDALRSRPPFNHGTHPHPPCLLDNSDTDICRSFNVNGCHRSSCVYSHVCTVCKQRGDSRRSHRDQQPNTVSHNVQPRAQGNLRIGARDLASLYANIASVCIPMSAPCARKGAILAVPIVINNQILSRIMYNPGPRGISA